MQGSRLKKIVFVHLLNDFSGSPKVLSQTMEVADSLGFEVHLYTCSDGVGFLDNVKGKRFSFPYKRFTNKVLTLFSFLSSQFILFLKLLKCRKDIDKVIYINTMLPFGAALAGKLMGKRVIFHIHETSLKPQIFKKILRLIIKVSASEIIFVSEYLRKIEVFDRTPSKVIYNGIAGQKYLPESRKHGKGFSILMICSLKAYKGVLGFVSLAREILKIKPDVRFTLILNASETDIKRFFQDEVLPENLTVHAELADVTSFYVDAALLLNLSNPDDCIETFGLTIVEGMSYGLPVIVPPVGGPSEIVRHDEQGYLIDSRDLDELIVKVCYLIDHPSEYDRLSANAFNRAQDFSLEVFGQKIEDLLI